LFAGTPRCGASRKWHRNSRRQVLDITATSLSLGIVAGRVENLNLVPLLKAIKDVTAIKEVQPR
jgi:hypothetical protein